MSEIIISNNLVPKSFSSTPLPALLQNADDKLITKFLEFFVARIRNKNTRAAYGRNVNNFFTWCKQNGAERIEDINSFFVSAYIEKLSEEFHPQTVRQNLSAINQIFAWLTKTGTLNNNPAEHVAGPRYLVKKGKTPTLSPHEIKLLIESIDTSKIIGLRDRAIIGIMAYTFARVSAVVNMNLEDFYISGAKAWVRFTEKGGKHHEMPLHHLATEYLEEYVAEAKRIGTENWLPPSPLFRSSRGHKNILSNNRIYRQNINHMIYKYLKRNNIKTQASCHSFRASGITTYLENGGSINNAQKMANHASIQTTLVYDHTSDKVTLTEIERIRYE